MLFTLVLCFISTRIFLYFFKASAKTQDNNIPLEIKSLRREKNKIESTSNDTYYEDLTYETNESPDVDSLFIDFNQKKNINSKSKTIMKFNSPQIAGEYVDKHCSRIGHSERISLYAGKIASIINDPQIPIETAQTAGYLHDIGLFDYPWTFTNEEQEAFNHIYNSYQFTSIQDRYNLLKLHPERSIFILNFSNFSPIISEGILYHHERLDGSGYPYGLKGSAIPLLSQIISICEYFDYLSIQLSTYETNDDAFEILYSHRNDYFDKDLINCMIASADINQKKKELKIFAV